MNRALCVRGPSDGKIVECRWPEFVSATAESQSVSLLPSTKYTAGFALYEYRLETIRCEGGGEFKLWLGEETSVREALLDLADAYWDRGRGIVGGALVEYSGVCVGGPLDRRWASSPTRNIQIPDLNTGGMYYYGAVSIACGDPGDITVWVPANSGVTKALYAMQAFYQAIREDE